MMGELIRYIFRFHNAMKQDDFSKCMNPLKLGWDGIADTKIFPDLSMWVVCPYCGKEFLVNAE